MHINSNLDNTSLTKFSYFMKKEASYIKYISLKLLCLMFFLVSLFIIITLLYNVLVIIYFYFLIVTTTI